MAEHRHEVERLHSQTSDLRSQLDTQTEKFSHLQKENQEKTVDLEEVNLKLVNLESDLQIKASRTASILEALTCVLADLILFNFMVLLQCFYVC